MGGTKVVNSTAPLGRRMHALADAFDPKSNAIGFMRLALATLVIVGHTWPLGGYGGGPLSRWSHGDIGFGSLAVTGFFVLSGFLIARSLLERPQLGRYLWHRSLRILPGFWVALLVSAGFFGALFWVIEGHSIGSYLGISLNSPESYVTDNWWLAIRQGTIGQLLTGVPFKHSVNGSLWTLVIEFKCYLALALVGLVAAKSKLHLILPVTAVALWAIQLWWLVVPDAAFQLPLLGGVEPLRLAIDFFVGTSFYVFRRRIPIDYRLAIVAAAVFFFSLPFGAYRLVGGVTFAYVMLWLACRLPIRSFDRRGDLSYGMYLYAFPVMQTLALVGATALGPIGFIVASTTLTLPFAAFSWFVVEHPAMQLRHRSWRDARSSVARIGNGVVSMVDRAQRSRRRGSEDAP